MSGSADREVDGPGRVSRLTPDDRSWFGEIDLDPDGAHPTMGTRSLGSRPWLVADDLRDAELAYKHHLLTERHGEVFAALAGSDGPSRETLALVEADPVLEAGADVPDVVDVADDLHPLDRAGRMVQEDLCLMEPTDDGWVLSAASLCFPSQWRLRAKLGRPMVAIHEPVPGYAEVLDRRVDTLFDRLGDRIVWRRNWFLRPDFDLFHPDRSDPRIVPPDRCLDELYVRSECQTLRRLEDSGWILFTIRTHHARLREFVSDPGCRDRFARFVADVDPDLAQSHSIRPAQLDQLRSVNWEVGG